MKINKFLALTTICILFINNTFGQLDDYYKRVKENPDVITHVLDNNIELINVYKNQIKLLHENRALSIETQQDSFATAMYRDYPILWKSFFGINKYRTLLKDDWEILNNPNIYGIWLPFSFNIENTFEEIGNKFYKLTGHQPKGKWYLFYGTGNNIGDMGGFDKFMWANFPVIGRKEKFIFNLPHEFNHMVFNKTNKSNENLLRYIIDEGLACYVNELYWERQYSPAEILVFEQNDWDWAIENEKKIFDFTKQYLDSNNYDIISKFHSWGESIWEGTPSRLAYFIGYQIIKDYINKHGKESLSELYTMDCTQILKNSDYEENL